MPNRMGLPEILPPGQSQNSLTAVGYATPIPSPSDAEQAAPVVPLSHYVWILRRHLWKIVSMVATCVLATAIVSARLKPIYESTATVDIDRQLPSEVIGDDSHVNPQATNDADQFLATQVKVVQSDAVLRPVAQQFNLREQEGQLKGRTPEQRATILAAPVSLKRLKVVRPPNTYLLLISYRSPDPQLASDAANAIARSYLNHTYEIRIQSSSSMSTFMEKQIEELKAKMEKSSLALAEFEKNLDVVNPEEKTNILSARLLQLNTDYTSAQADRVSKEAAWNAMKSGSLEAAQVSTQGQELARLNDAMNQARQRFALIKSTYGPSHPEYRKAESEVSEIERQYEATRKNIADRIRVEYNEAVNREQMLQKAVVETKAEWDQINSRSFEYQQLKREADADKTLYDELIKKIREAGINAGFQSNNIRIVDLARPGARPVFPNFMLNLFLAFLFSSILAIGLALLQDTLDTTLRDPKEASRFLGVDVIGMLPSDRASAQPLRMTASAETSALQAAVAPNGNRRGGQYRSISGFDESIRTIRNTILLSDFEGRLRSIMITSASPGDGKSTITSQLAISIADRNKKTLLVDGDLRRPSIHAKFDVPCEQGLSTVLNGEVLWQEALQRVEGRPNLHILPAGPGSHRAADLIGPRLSSLLDEFAKEYDLVLLDSPPILGFAECLQMAAAADGVVIVSRAGKTRRRAVAEVMSVLSRLRANVLGLILNQVEHNMSSEGYYGYGYRYSGYGYRYDQAYESQDPGTDSRAAS